MNRKEINFSEMLQSVDNFLSKNTNLYQHLHALVQAQTDLHAINEDIFALNQQQAVDTTVETKLKGSQKKELIQLITKISVGLLAHAAATNDTKLKLSASVSEWDLKNMRENDLVIKAKAIYDLALPLAESLAIWGVTKADIDLLAIDYAGFKQKTPDNRNLRAQSTLATTTLKEKIEQGRILLKEKVDPMMQTFKSINPTFYAEYSVARTVVERAAGHSKSDEAESKEDK